MSDLQPADIVQKVRQDLDEARREAAKWRAREQNLAQALQGLMNAYPMGVDSRPHPDRGTVELIRSVLEKKPVDAPKGRDAVVQIMQSQPDRLFDTTSMLEEMQRRGWEPGGTDPEGSVRQALKRAFKSNEARREPKDGRSFFYGLHRPGDPIVLGTGLSDEDDVEAEDGTDEGGPF